MIEIKTRYGLVLYKGDFDTVKECVEDALKNKSGLQGAVLQGAVLQGAVLRWADLRGADLYRADLHRANLRGADLQGADLWSCRGNGREIKSLQISRAYDIAYTAERLQIGCENHSIDDWWEFDDDRIRQMNRKKAIDFWVQYKDLIRQTIKVSPAEPTKHE